MNEIAFASGGSLYSNQNNVFVQFIDVIQLHLKS